MPFVIRLANKLGLVDDPIKRQHPAHTHVGVIPRAGGLAIYLAILLTVVVYLPFSVQLLAILVAGGLAVAVGVWDDYHDVSPYIRLATNGVVAGIVVLSGVGISYVTNPLGGILQLDTIQITLGSVHVPLLASIAAMGWIMWMMNAVGWSAGVDGQLPGFVFIASLVIAVLSLRFLESDPSQSLNIALAAITAGAFLGFLAWNFYPQRIMPGYGGKSLAGFMLAVISILSSAKIGTALLVLSVPLVDAGYTLLRRLIRGKSPFKADRGHLHHLLLDRGWGKRRIAVFYWIVTAVMGGIALSLDSQGKVMVFVAAAIAIGGALFVLSFFQSLQKRAIDKKN